MKDEQKPRKRKSASHHKKGTPEHFDWLLSKRIAALEAWRDPEKRKNITKGRWGTKDGNED